MLDERRFFLSSRCAWFFLDFNSVSWLLLLCVYLKNAEWKWKQKRFNWRKFRALYSLIKCRKWWKSAWEIMSALREEQQTKNLLNFFHRHTYYCCCYFTRAYNNIRMGKKLLINHCVLSHTQINIIKCQTWKDNSNRNAKWSTFTFVKW